MNHLIHGASFESEAETMDAAQIKNAQKNVSLMLRCLPEHECYIQINIGDDDPSNVAAFAVFSPDREFLRELSASLGKLYDRQKRNVRA